MWDDLAAQAYSWPGNYRHGIIAVKQTCDNRSQGTPDLGDFPTFQSALAARHMVDYYLMVDADPDLPALIKAEVDFMIAGADALTGSEQGNVSPNSFTHSGTTYTFASPRYGYPYWARVGAGRASGQGCGGYTICMFGSAIAFVHKYYGGNAPDGTPYLTWYQRAMNVGPVYHVNGLAWSWKIFGEVLGGNMGR